MCNTGIFIVHKKGFYANLVTFFTSKKNHSAIFTKDYVFEMVLSSKDRSNDLICIKRDEYEKNNEIISTHKINCDEQQLIKFFNENRNKKYDYWRTVLWFFFFLKKTGSKNKWNCVEACYEFFNNQNIKLWDGKNISPEQLDLILESDEK